MRKTKKQRFRASILAFLLIASMVLGMAPGSAGQVYAKESTSQTSSEEEPGVIDKAVGFLKDKGEKIASFFGAGDEAQPAAAYDESKVVDPETYATWEGIAGATTEHVGRIWTDKTVTTKDVTLPGGATPQGTIGDSDFLVMLSALSSTSNLVSTSSKPLDIVMVLDVSGSMANGTMRQEAFYRETYDINTDVLNVLIGPTYYALVDGQYVKVEPVIGRWHVESWKLNRQTVVPKESASDTNGIQFYTREERTITYMQALQEAANSFVEATAAENDTIGKAEDQHRISVVKFADDSHKYEYGNNFTGEKYNYTQRLNALTAYNSENVSGLTDKISALRAAGGTAADFGMDMAQQEFTDNGRADAQKVVIFFTDGEPNHGNGFESDVAKDAIGTAKTMKDAGALVYTIGVFSGADENDMSSYTNRYMQAMSSNYPTATGYQGDEIGDKTTEEGAAYYKAASDADTLNSIFDTIFDQITTGSGAPTQIEEGKDQNNSGYVTFTDQLGAYMQVDGFREVLFADQTFKNPTVTTDDTKGITTYKYSGAVAADEIYPAGDMADLMIEVKKGASLAEGDTVTVKVPARMLPLCNFQATNVNGQITMQKPLAYPIRIFYGVSLKPAVETTLANGLGTTDEEKDTDTALEAYIKNNTTNGKTAFYSNNYDGTKISGDKKLGNTTATFVPSTKNTFYYFTSDTLLYKDIECTQPLKLKKGEEAPEGEIYYYKRSYVETTDEGTGASEMKTKTYAFNSENLNLILNSQSNAWEVNAEGQVYLVAGTPRLTRVDATTSSKSENTTGTATEVINPLWDNPAAPNAVNVYLGNNGKLSKELPGALVITKDARVAANKDLDVNVTKDKDFTFRVHVDGVSGNRWAEVKNAEGDVVKKAFEITFDEQGNCTTSITLQDDQTLYIYGLNKDAQYQVTESESMPAGFQLVEVNGNKVTEAAESEKATGTIKAGQKETATFTNEYDVASTTVKGTDFAKYKKAWKENDERWDVAESFNFYLFADHENNPMPEGAQETQIQGVTAKVKKVTVNKDSFTGDFGEVTFTKPGTYTYSIIEETPVPTVAGMSYSGADYTVTVTVTDQGDGTLKAEAVMTKVSGDDGITLAKGEEVADKTAIFTNAFSAQSVSDGPGAQKVYTDKSGAKPLTDGMFQFKIKAVGSNAQEAPFPANSQADNEGWHTMTNTGSIIQFGQAAFTEDHVNQTFTYEFKEVMPAEANADNQYTVNGMTYDPTIYTVEFAVTHEAIQSDKNEAARVKVTKKYYEGTGENKVQITDQEVVFSNQYDPADLVIPSDIADALTGSKILNGRDTKEGEAFTFTLSAADQATEDALTNDVLVFQGDIALEKSEISVTDLKNNNAKDFQFGEVRITQPGTYCFNVVENAPADNSGMTYDRHTAQVTVKVKDNNGRLELDGPVTYNNGEGKATDKAEFVNTYSASTGYGTDMSLQIGKTLQGRPLESGEFTFAISGIQTANSVTKEEADQKLSPTDKNFTNTQRADAGVESLIVDKMSGVAFDQNDAGKTFCYQIEEVKPENALPGVTYSTEKWVLEITVHDNADGTMYTTSKVSRSGDESNVTEYNGKDGSDTAKVTFTNIYADKEVTVDTTNANIGLKKILKGRAWTGNDSFKMTLSGNNGAPMPAIPENSGITANGDGSQSFVVTADDGTASGTEIPFGFGTITFNQTGVYIYDVKEEHAGETINGIAYEPDTARIVVTVTNQDEQGKYTGQLKASVKADYTTFENVYRASVDQDAAAPIKVTKTLSGRDMKAQEFTFKLTALDGTDTNAADAAKKAGMGSETAVTFDNQTAGTDGTVVTVLESQFQNFTFDLSDVGKTYKYQFEEVKGNAGGVTYDTTTYELEMSAADNGDGTMTVTVVVTDSKNKEQPATYTGSAAQAAQAISLAFTNSYAASGTLDGAANLAGTKEMNGPWEATGKNLSGFQFTITGGDDETNAAIEKGDVTLPTEKTATSDVTGKFNFDDITFNKKGTYKFTVSEVVPEDNNKIPGVAYDANPVTITVEVTDNNNGTLTAALAEGSPELTFTNTYATTQDATFTPSVVKKVEGLDAKENFTFKLSAADEATKQAIDDATIIGIGTMADKYSSEKATTEAITKDNQQTVNFNELTFKKAGTYKFAVKETNANAPTGWTYDSHTYEITIDVTDKDSVLTAQMQVTNPNTNSRIFTNRFAATTTYGAEGGLNVTKTLNGRTLKEDMFNFTIVGEATDSVTAKEANAKLEDTDKNFKNTAPGEDGVAVMSKLGAVQFDETDIEKTYRYAVQEIAGTDTKYTYDNVSATVAIRILENNGELYTVTTVTKGEAVQAYSSINGSATAVAPFVNSYTPNIETVEPGTFGGNVTKVLKGNRVTELAAGEFNFQMTITAKDGSDMNNVVLPEGANNGTVTAENKADGSVSFGNIQFKAAGTYHVEINEVIPEKKDPNMTYDKHTFSYDIEVTYDASKGELSVKAVEDSKSGSPVFTNIYEADDAKDVANTDEPTTSVDGKVVGVGDRLTYTIDWVNNAVDETTGAPVKAEVTIKDIVPEGTKYVSAYNEGAYDQGTNTITWTLGEQEAGASGTVSFVVEVLDNAGGTDVTNKAKITVGNNDPKQTNEVTTNVPGKESVVEDGGELQVGKVLTYTISYKNPEEEASTVTIKDIIPEGLDYVEGSAGEFASYDAKTRTLTWTLENIEAGTNGTVTFQAKVNESAKTVIDNKATIQIGDNAPTYGTNTDQNEIPKDGNLAISKTIALAEGQGTEINKEQTFTFTVELKDAKGSALTKEYAYTVTDGDQKTAEGKIANAGTISLKHGQKATITGLPAGAQYKVTETEAAGYTADALVKEGTVAAKKTANADFTNTYSVAGSLSGSDALTVTKELVGREWLDTDTFAYRLTAADEATKKAVQGEFITLPDNASKLEITKESAEHQEAFGDIQFTIAGMFKFNVTEQTSGIAGITDDQEAERTVVVKVTDKKDGTLEIVIVEDKSENLTFTNTYGAGTGEDDIAAQIPATKKLTGRDMKAEEFQFEVVTRKADENAENFKEEVVATGTNKAAKADVAGTVTFAGKDDVKLTYTVESLNKAVEAGYAVKEVKEGQSVWTVSYTARELTDKLPGGVKAVEGKISYDFTIGVTDNNNGTLTAQVQAPGGGIAFENAYTTGGTEVDTDPIDTTAYFYKVLTGRDWSESDKFTFTIAPQDGAPAPEKTTATVKKADAKAGNSVPFGFGKIRFTDKDMAGATANEDGTLSKTFTYQITENGIDAEKMPGVTKDSHVATLTITVTDNQQGELSASANMTAENGTFTNTYKSSLDYTALSGLQITKVLNGRDMADGQFTFTVTPEDKDSADKLELTEGATEFTNTAKPAGETDTMDVLAGKSVTFTQEDAGKTFTYTVAEKAGDNKAYTYDDTPRTVTIEVKDNENAKLTVTTTVKKGSEVVDTQSVTTGDEGQKKATVAFVNTYNVKPETLGGDGEVKINAKKTLTNRPMVADEFKFHVKDNKNETVTSGTNSADGTITFAPVTYDTDKLIKDAKAGIAAKSVKEGAYVYTYDYTVVEAPTTDGVTGDATTFAIQVIVTDKGDGTLELKVQYPEGTDSLAFKNLYGEGAEAEITINGHKQYVVASGDNEPDITGKYTFTITGSKGALMPEKTEVTNDAAGNVTFGAITYTMENVFGDTGSKPEVAEAAEGAAEDEAEGDEKDLTEAKSAKREKTFTYTVAESGSVPGVQNDGSSKTFTVKVTDNGNGTIAVEKSWKENEFPFSFTNTYSVTPADYSINTDLTITKELDGRELREGEFTFEMVGEGETVLQEAVNAKDGSVTFGALTYEKPGTYNYVIREQKGSAGGVEYDSAEHTVVVVVTDNGDGTMTAKAELKSRDDEDAKNAIVFKNSYTAQPASVTLGASKAYTGGKLGDGQFTFELRDESDKLISKAKNNENGQIVFETIEYKNVGTYKYKISEVNDEQKHVTYDKTVYGVTVTVTDNQEGSLMAAVEYDGGKAPVFTNKYSKPAKPAKPEEPKGPTAVKTGDEAPVIPFIILMVATLAIIVTITFIFFRRKRR